MQTTSKKGVLKIMMNMSSDEKFTLKICTDVNKATTNDSSNGGEAIRQRTLYFEIYFERYGQHKKKSTV